MIRIYADFHKQDNLGRIPLTANGSVRDLETNKDLIFSGMNVFLYFDDEFEVEGVLVADEEKWYGEPDMSTIRYLEPPS